MLGSSSLASIRSVLEHLAGSWGRALDTGFIGPGDAMLSRYARAIRTAQCLAVGVLACGALGFSSGAANASTDRVYGGTMSIPNVVLSTDTCVEAPVRYDLNDIPFGYDWTINGEASNGSTLFDYGTGPKMGGTSVSWCDEDLPGKFTVTGTLTVRNENYEVVSESSISLRFTVRKMTTKATIRAGRKAPKVGQSFSLKGCVTAHGKRQEYRDITYEWKTPKGAWKKAGAGSTDGVGCYNQDVFIGKPGTVSLRIRIPGNSISTTGYSKTIKVKAHK